MADLDILRSIADRVIAQCFESGLVSLAPQDRTFFLLWTYGALVENGGHESFFSNSGGDHYVATLQALEQMHLPRFANLLRQAGHLLFAGEASEDTLRRNSSIEGIVDQGSSIEDQLAALDDAFFAEGGGGSVLDALETSFRPRPT